MVSAENLEREPPLLRTERYRETLQLAWSNLNLDQFHVPGTKGMDAKLFDAIFKHCDLGTLKSLLTDDFEFYHDRGGLIATNGAQFVEVIRKTCEGQKIGREVRSRRELVSMEIYPLNHYGAIQTGIHRFFIIRDGEPGQAGDVAKFTHVWRKLGNDWKIARVLSYDHKRAF